MRLLWIDISVRVLPELDLWHDPAAGSCSRQPPRSFPPSFNPANVLEETLRGIKAEKKLKAAFPMLNTETSN